MADISPDQLNAIKHILAEYAGGCEVRMFGSRVNGTAGKHSDVDLAIICKDKLQRRTKTLLKEAFEESDLPFRVDIIEYNAVSDSFREIIDKQYEVVQNNE